jgi:hypothetical protein
MATFLLPAHALAFVKSQAREYYAGKDYSDLLIGKAVSPVCAGVCYVVNLDGSREVYQEMWITVEEKGS